MAQKTQLDIPVLLPEVPDIRDACVDRLCDRLADEAGIEQVHLREATASSPDQLCIHYDPDRITLARIRTLAQRLGAEFTEQFGHVTWQLEDVTHPRRARVVDKRIREIPGVLAVECSSGGKVHIEFDRSVLDEMALLKASQLRDLGRLTEGSPKPPSDSSHHHHHGSEGARLELILAILAGVFTVTGWGLDTFTGAPPYITVSIFVAGYLCGGLFATREAWESIRGGQFDIDFLMLVAAIGAAALGNWFEGALLLFSF